jgi:hypothetical protein
MSGWVVQVVRGEGETAEIEHWYANLDGREDAVRAVGSIAQNVANAKLNVLWSLEKDIFAHLAIANGEVRRGQQPT